MISRIFDRLRFVTPVVVKMVMRKIWLCGISGDHLNEDLNSEWLNFVEKLTDLS